MRVRVAKLVRDSSESLKLDACACMFHNEMQFSAQHRTMHNPTPTKQCGDSIHRCESRVQIWVCMIFSYAFTHHAHRRMRTMCTFCNEPLAISRTQTNVRHTLPSTVTSQAHRPSTQPATRSGRRADRCHWRPRRVGKSAGV